MCTEAEIEQAISVLLKYGLTKKNISILHCNTEYPTPMNDVNLLAMLSIKEKFGVDVGYSDHTLGIEVPIAAVALGAKIIEKHITLNRNLPGPDHAASIEPNEFCSMVKAIRNIELAISGNGIKIPSESETKNIAIARKSIHLANDLICGQIITENDLIALRPGDGISPMAWESIIGKKLSVNKFKFDKLSLSDIL
jgi:N-acetylneuraminate synthase/N,N'-diacetyllegionaminate synthase